MVRKNLMFGGCILLILLVIPMVLATQTEVKIKTIPWHEVQASASGGGQIIQRFINQSDEYGDITFLFDFSNSKYDLFIYIKKDGNSIADDKQYGLITGEPVSFELAPADFELFETPDSGLEDNEIVVNDAETDETDTDEINETDTAASTSTDESTDTTLTNETDTEETTDTTSKDETDTEETNKTTLINIVGINSTSISNIVGSVISKTKENKSILVYCAIGICVIGGIVVSRKYKISIVPRKGSNVSSNVVNFSGEGKSSGKGKLQGLKEEVDELRHEMK